MVVKRLGFRIQVFKETDAGQHKGAWETVKSYSVQASFKTLVLQGIRETDGDGIARRITNANGKVLFTMKRGDDGRSVVTLLSVLFLGIVGGQ